MTESKWRFLVSQFLASEIPFQFIALTFANEMVAQFVAQIKSMSSRLLDQFNLTLITAGMYTGNVHWHVHWHVHWQCTLVEYNVHSDHWLHNGTQPQFFLFD